jgi:hypothetical protein
VLLRGAFFSNPDRFEPGSNLGNGVSGDRTGRVQGVLHSRSGRGGDSDRSLLVEAFPVSPARISHFRLNSIRDAAMIRHRRASGSIIVLFKCFIAESAARICAAF